METETEAASLSEKLNIYQNIRLHMSEYSKYSDRLWGLPSLLNNGYLPRGKLVKPGADFSVSCSAGVKSAWSFIFPSSIHLHDVMLRHRDNFTVTFTCAASPKGAPPLVSFDNILFSCWLCKDVVSS
jgi:hypothetical protein